MFHSIPIRVCEYWFQNKIIAIKHNQQNIIFFRDIEYDKWLVILDQCDAATTIRVYAKLRRSISIYSLSVLCILLLLYISVAIFDIFSFISEPQLQIILHPKNGFHKEVNFASEFDKIEKAILR